MVMWFGIRAEIRTLGLWRYCTPGVTLVSNLAAVFWAAQPTLVLTLHERL